MVDTEPAVPEPAVGCAEPGSLGAEPGPVRGRDAAGRAGPGDRGRRLGQDPRAHAPARVPRRASSTSSPFEILAITFTNKAAGEMRERVAELVGPVGRRMWVSTFHAACSRILRREASLLGYRSSFTIYDQADAARLTDWVRRDLEPRPEAVPGPPAPRADQRAEERADPARASTREMARRPGRAAHRRDLHRVPAPARRGVGRRLRRPARARRAAVPRAPRSARRGTSSASGTCSSTSSRTPTPRSGSSCACSREEHRSVMVVGDVDQSDLQVPRRRLPEPVEVRGGVPRSDDRRARPELPVDAAHPRRRQRGHREQRVAPPEAPLDRQGRRRADRPLPGRRRARRGRVRRARDPPARRRRRASLRRRRGLLPHERAEPRARRVARARRACRTACSAA